MKVRNHCCYLDDTFLRGCYLARELAEGLLEEEPYERLSMKEALRNAWLQDMVEMVAIAMELWNSSDAPFSEEGGVETQSQSSPQMPVVSL